MLRRAAVAIVLIGCTPERPGPDLDPDTGLPVGVWEPDPEAIGGELVADAGTIWFAYSRLCEIAPCPSTTTTWLVHTDPDGAQLHEPVRVDTSVPSYASALAVTDSTVIVALRRYTSDLTHAAIRVFDRDARPLESAEHPLELRYAGVGFGVENVGLVATGDRARLVVTPYAVNVPEFPGAIAVTDLDAEGQVLADIVPIGTPDEGSSANLTATALGDGSTLVAWDHFYDACTGDRRSAFAQTAPVSNELVPGTLLSVRDLPERDESHPALASAGGSTFVAWQGDWHEGVSLARYPELEQVALFGEPGVPHTSPHLALADESHGAIAWMTHDTGNGSVSVAPFAFENGQLRAGRTRVLPRIGEPASRSIVGIVHIEADVYVVAWREGHEREHLYAMQIDFAQTADLTAPPSEASVPTSTPPPRLRRRPCTH